MMNIFRQYPANEIYFYFSREKLLEKKHGKKYGKKNECLLYAKKRI